MEVGGRRIGLQRLSACKTILQKLLTLSLANCTVRCRFIIVAFLQVIMQTNGTTLQIQAKRLQLFFTNSVTLPFLLIHHQSPCKSISPNTLNVKSEFVFLHIVLEIVILSHSQKYWQFVYFNFTIFQISFRPIGPAIVEKPYTCPLIISITALIIA